MQIAVHDKMNKEVKKISLKPEIFGLPDRQQLLFETVRGMLLNQRQGTVKAKTRGEVSGSTAKIYKQKGTGRARHGDIKANIFVGGGNAFPPLPRNWRVGMNKKAKQRALCQALTVRKKEGNLLVVDTIHCDAIKTKTMAEQLKKWKLNGALLVIEKQDEKLWKSVRNIPHIELTTAQDLNALDILSFGKLVVTEKALAGLEKRLS